MLMDARQSPGSEPLPRAMVPEMAVVGGMGVHYQGITSGEVYSACMLLRVPRREWPEVVDDVQHMGRTVARAINAKVQSGGS